MDNKELMKKTEPKGIWKYLLVFAVILGPALIFMQGLDNDVWFMIAHGNYLFENGFKFPTTEILTVHDTIGFSLEKWLSCVLFAGVYNLFGEWGLIVFTMLVALLTGCLMFKACKEVSDNNYWVSLLGTFMASAVLSMAWYRTRPQIFSYVCLLLEFIVLEKYVKTKNKKWLYALPLVSCLLIQFHSTMWVMYLIVLLPYLCGKISFKNLIAGGEYETKPILMFGLLGVATALINPNTYRSILYLFNSFGSDQLSTISELCPMNYKDALFLVPTSLFLILWFVMKHDKPLPTRYLLFWLGTFAMALVALRNVSYFALFSIFLPVYLWKDVAIGAEDKTIICIVVLLLGAGTYFVVDNTLTGFMFEQTPCKEIVDDFTETIDDPSQVRLFTTFNDGAYAEFKGFKVYIDPRAEVFTKDINGKEDIFDEYGELISGQKTYDEIQEKYDFDYWLVPKTASFNRYIERDYETVMENDDYLILKP